MIDPQDSAFPEWMFKLPYQQQSVLVLGLRGPDGVRKHHPMKDVQRHYRGSILKAALYGRELHVPERADTFMSTEFFTVEGTDNWRVPTEWGRAVKAYFEHVDELPHHFHLHLVHGAQILGIHHPNLAIRYPWRWFYIKACEDAHMEPETDADMNTRLGDWGKRQWGE